ncbi:MAG TPA: methyltransferase [Tepidisphaeraceae bacterium]|nr:methyltransferase [Tepidisphaeraceae bacterium]
MDSASTGERNDSGAKAQPALTPQRIMEIAWGFGPPLVIGAAIRHRIFDVLSGEAKDVDQVAAETGASHRGLRTIMDALVGLGLLKRQGSQYELTPESDAFLVSTRAEFRGGMFRHLARMMIPLWLELDEVVKNGKPAKSVNRESTGPEFFRQFVEDLFPMNYPGALALARELSQTLRPSRAGEQVKVLDLAAGAGVWGIALAESSPAVHVTALDFPQVTPIARQMAARRGLADRYSTIEGELLKADFGSGYRVATLGHILHSEGEAKSRMLLRKVFDALAPGGTIVVAEFMPDDDRNGPPMPLLFAVNMLVATDEGATFTFAQISNWLREAGFQNPRQLQAPAPSPLVLADKPMK